MGSDDIIKQGSDINAALSDASLSFGEEPIGKIIILTDGDEEEITIERKTLELLKRQQLQVSVIGVGSPEGGNIPTANISDPYERYDGKVVRLKLNRS